MALFTKDQIIEQMAALGIPTDETMASKMVVGVGVEVEHAQSVGNNLEIIVKIAYDHIKEDQNYYTKLEKMENSKGEPAIFYARHMKDGIAGYLDEKVLVDEASMKRMIPSFLAKPVYVHHQEVDVETMKEKASGYVTDSFYNSLDGWLWVKMVIVDDIGLKAIQNGWGVSNAYIPTEWSAAGTYLNCEYDRAITNGEFTHLAIVNDPRYERAKVFTPEAFKAYQDGLKSELDELQNSKSKGTRMFKIFKTKQVEVSEVDGTTSIELQNGKKMLISEMVNAVEEKEKENEAEEEKKNAEEMTVKVNGEDMTVKELVNKYQKLNKASAKKNADDIEEAKENEGDEDEKENEDEAEDGKKDEKKNAKHFDELKNAKAIASSAEPIRIDTAESQILRGLDRYG